ncbi:MAG: zinc transporter ZupT [Sulfurovum sp. FS08-3]|nr:MAG: zinc transporter ZupT [Sulfurovum sp. FS08-3]
MHDITLESFLIAFGLTLVAGFSTAIGAILAFFSKEDNYKMLSIGLGFSAGVMIYVSFMEIMVKSKEAFMLLYAKESVAEGLMLLCFVGGILVSALIDKLVPSEVNPHQPKSDDELQVLKPNHPSSLNLNNLKRTGLFTAIAISIHNFPEGFATFVAALDDLSLGVAIMVAIAIHNIPEGMAVSLPIYYATKNRKKAFGYAVLSGVAEPIGAVVGFFVLLPLMGDFTLAITFGVVAGIMIYISFDELLPASRIYGDEHTTILGIVMGMMVMGVSLVLL